jgi:Peptidoglycan-binding protein, CsiV
MTSLPKALTALLMASGLTAGIASAQDVRPYKVELLMFIQGSSASSSEQWQDIPDLSYDNDSQFLIYQDQIDSVLQEFPGQWHIDSRGRLIISQAEDTADTQPTVDGPAATDESAEPAPQLYQPFHVLGPEHQDLNAGSARIRSSGRRIVFHESWIQPIGPLNAALPIVLDNSGDTGEWPQVQGSITLSLSRYLHLETNLWVNTYGDYLPQGWSLPAAPLSPPSVLVNDSPLPLARLPQVDEDEAGYANNTPLVDTAAESDPVAEAQYTAITENPWPYRHAIKVQEKRRMRSKEIHYIDHPLLGIVILFTPIDLKALEEQAEGGVYSALQANQAQ